MPSVLQIARDPIGRLFWGAAKGTARAAWAGATAGPIGRTAFGAAVGAGVGYARSDYNSPTLTVGETIKGAAFGGLLGFGTSTIAPLARAGWKTNLAMGKRAYESSLIGPRLPGGSFLSMGPLGKTGTAERESMQFWGALGTSPAARMMRTTGAAYKNIGTGIYRAAVFAFENPLVVGGTTLGGMGLIAASRVGQQSFSSPTLQGAQINAQYDRQAIAAEQLQMSGISPSGYVGTAPQMLGNMQATMMQSTDGLVQGLHRGRH